MRFVIKKGKHRPAFWWWYALKGIWLFRRPKLLRVSVAIFDSWYDPAPGKRDHWQKLGGVSFGLHHDNSIRAVFRPYKNGGVKGLWEFAKYVYADGKLSELTLNSDFPYEKGTLLRGTPTVNHGYITSGIPLLEIYKTSWWGYYFLYPYIEFEDNEGAPCDMVIHLEVERIS
jgi:hypothetical protein